MFNPDRPINSVKEDILGRSSFAENLATSILSYDHTESITIGLYGEWGSGKTSIINMVVEYLKKLSGNAQKSEPILMSFYPWNYSDQNQLITQFFDNLSRVLGREDNASKIKKAGEKLVAYSKLIKPLSLIPPITLIADGVSKSFENVGTSFKELGEEKSNNLEEIKAELNNLLQSQSQKIVIIIDDIDRLNNVEIRQIFQLVKSLGDFPNTIYLLAFDRNVVINALEKVQRSGKDYLEKVVQIPFEIPATSKHDINNLLLQQLDILVKDIPKNKFDNTYWGNIYHSGIKYFYKNIRDVTRYINSLRLSFDMIKGEVNTIDFLAITAIQVFIPEVYCGIRDNKEVFTGTFRSAFGNIDSAKEQARIRCDEIIRRASNYSEGMLKDFLIRLFPKLESIYGNTNYNESFLNTWRKKCRICSPDFFDIYFKLSFPEGEILPTEMENILSLAHDHDLFSESMNQLNNDGRIVRFLERMEDYTREDIPIDHIGTIITVLMNIGDTFPEGKKSIFDFDTPMKILRIFYQLLHRIDDKEKRFNILKNAIDKANDSIYTCVHEVSVQGQQHGKFSSNERPMPEQEQTLTLEQLDKLEKLACDKINNWAEEGRLADHKELPRILFQWRRWGCENIVNEFITNMIETDEGLINFISGFLSESTSHGMSDYVAEKHKHINLESIGKLVDIGEIEPRIRELRSSTKINQLGEKEQKVINLFLDTYDGKVETPF